MSNSERRHIQDSDQFVSAREIWEENDQTQNWTKWSIYTVEQVEADQELLNFTAQTPLAASYGLLQIMYVTAIRSMRWEGIGAAKNPSYLFDTTGNLAPGVEGGSLELGSGYLKRMFLMANRGISQDNPDLADPKDLQDAFFYALNYYNTNKRKTLDYIYGKEVMERADLYTPVAETPEIFP